MRTSVVALMLVVALTASAAALLLIVIATSSGSTAIADLEQGDCFDLPVADDDGDVATIDTVEVVDCDEPHEAEVVLAGRLDPEGERPYPSDAELFAEIDRRCRPTARAIGDGIGVVPIAPTAASWEARGGPFQCVALRVGGGSLTGAIVDG